MSVAVSLIGRLGNNLFQYALGRIIAERHGIQLDCSQIYPTGQSLARADLGTADGATITELSSFFPNAPLHIPGRRFESPVQSFELEGVDNWRGHLIDLDRILKDPTARHIRIRGWFQRIEYYEHSKDKIHEWFVLAQLPIPYELNKRDVVVSIRRGTDFGLNNWTVPLDYYDEALSSLRPHGAVFVCGTGVDHAVRNRLAKYKPIYYDASPIEHFNFIMKFNRIILSNSTFAWWAAFLSSAEEILAPRFVHGRAYCFTGYGDVDLAMREARYHEIAVEGPVPFALLSRKRGLNVHFAHEGRSLVIDNGSDVICTIHVDDTNRDLLTWFCKQEGHIVVSQLFKRSPRNVINRILNDLIESGVLSVNPGYLE